MFKTWLARHREMHLGTTAAVRRMRAKEQRAARPKAAERTAMGDGTPMHPTNETLESRPPHAAPQQHGLASGPRESGPDMQEDDAAVAAPSCGR